MRQSTIAMPEPSRRQILRLGVATVAVPVCAAIGCEQNQSKPNNSPIGTTPVETSPMQKPPQQPTVTPFLMFAGDAEAAMNLYVEVFPNSKVDNIEKYGAGEDGPEGTVKVAAISLNGQKVMCIDSPVKHEFGFTPAISLYVASNDADSIERYFNELSKGGKIMMPLGEYPFSKKFAWITDRFGVSWQLATT